MKWLYEFMYIWKSYEFIVYMNSYMNSHLWIHIHMNSYNHYMNSYMKWIYEFMSIWIHEYMNSNANSCIWIQMNRFWIHCIHSEFMNLISLTVTWIHDMNSLLKIRGIQYSELVLLNSVVKPFSSVKISTVLAECKYCCALCIVCKTNKLNKSWIR